MKWFKHSGSSLRTAAIERLIMEFGISGYGLYFACVEMIAGSLSPDNVTFELEHDAELLAHKFKMDTLQVERIMYRCIELGLFELADSGHVTCMKLALLVDDYFSRSPEIRSIAASPLFLEAKTHGDIRKSDTLRTKSDQIRLDKIRLEEKDKREPKRFHRPTVEQIREYCTERKNSVDPQRFVDFYESKGWKIGKSPMKDWKAAVRTWERNDKPLIADVCPKFCPKCNGGILNNKCRDCGWEWKR